MHDAIESRDEGVLLRVRLQPKASRNAVAGIAAEHVRIAVTSPPVDGAANQALIAFLSKLLGVKKGHIEIKSGGQSRSKTLLIHAETVERVRAVLMSAVNP